MVKNAALVVFSILISLIATEWILWRPNLMLVPPQLHAQLGRIALFAQASKNATRPARDYVMLIGDSYAEGLGDWMMEALARGGKKYNAAHVIHDLTGRDVLSIGMRGGNPLETYVRRTTELLHGINQYFDITLQGPKDLVLYFTEGNDVSDNKALFEFFLAETFPRECPLDIVCIEKVVATLSANASQGMEKRWWFGRNLNVLDAASKIVKLIVKNYQKGYGAFQSDDPAYYVNHEYQEYWERYNRSSTRIRVGGRNGAYPANTVEPLPFHSEDEIKGAANVFGRSLAYVKRYLKPDRVFVVYIPTPIIAYHLTSTIKISDRIRMNRFEERAGEPTEFTDSTLIAKSNAICSAIQEQAAENNAVFIDMRPRLRDITSERGYVHGPNDPGHFNKLGNTVLGRMIADALRTGTGIACGLS